MTFTAPLTMKGRRLGHDQPSVEQDGPFINVSSSSHKPQACLQFCFIWGEPRHDPGAAAMRLLQLSERSTHAPFVTTAAWHVQTVVCGLCVS